MNSRGRFVVNDRAPQGFDLSRNESLRTLETTADSISMAGDAAVDFLKTILSSVTSPAPLDVVVIYRERDFGGGRPCPLCEPDPVCFSHCGPPINSPIGNMLKHFLHNQHRRFRVFREMHSVREFRLVFCVDVVDCMMSHALRLLGNIFQDEEARREFDYLLYEPFIICERRMLRTRVTDFIVGSTTQNVPASAL